MEEGKKKKKKLAFGRWRRRGVGRSPFTDALSAENTSVGACDGAGVSARSLEGHGAKGGNALDGRVAVGLSADAVVRGLGDIVVDEASSGSLDAVSRGSQRAAAAATTAAVSPFSFVFSFAAVRGETEDGSGTHTFTLLERVL